MEVNIFVTIYEPLALTRLQLAHVSKHEWVLGIVADHTFQRIHEQLLFFVQCPELDMNYKRPSIINCMFKSGNDSFII